jgi:hypothetical protein
MKEFPTELRRRPGHLKPLRASVVPFKEGASFNLNSEPKIRNAAEIVFTQRLPKQEKLNGGS